MSDIRGLYRPAYHFMPHAHWMNDPNGPIWHRGYYHIFYQHNPNGDGWGNIHWGHARSRDLVNWERLPIALAPDAAIGEEHCFSGSAALDNDIPTILYSSVEHGRNQRHWATVRMARSHDGMINWTRESKPVLTQDIHSERVGEWRDPFIWRENNEWHMLMGGEQNGYGCIFLYRSSNLKDWKYVAPFLENKDAPFLECPNLLRFGDKSVLIYSPHGEVVYHVGEIDKSGKFITESVGALDNSGRKGFYAPNTILNDPKGRYLTWGWITEEARGSLEITGYNGALSIPRQIMLDDNGVLRQKPAEEYESLRKDAFLLPEQRLNGNKVPLAVNGRSFEISLRGNCTAGDDFSLVLLSSPDGAEQTRVRFSAAEKKVSLERGLTSLHNGPDKTFQSVILNENYDKLDIRIFLDHSIIEIFVNESQAITGRLYPSRSDANGVYLEGIASSISASAWSLRPASFCMASESTQSATATLEDSCVEFSFS